MLDVVVAVDGDDGDSVAAAAVDVDVVAALSSAGWVCVAADDDAVDNDANDAWTGEHPAVVVVATA